MEPRLSIITLGVKDLDTSRKFYHEGLGFPPSKMSNEEIVFFKTGGVCLALYPINKLAEDVSPELCVSPTGFSGVTIAHNTRSKAEVVEILNKAKCCGGKILKPAQDTFWGGYSGYFTDPDGHLWEVAYADFWTFNSDGSLVIE